MIVAVLAIACPGALAAWLYDKLPPLYKRRASISAWGLAGIAGILVSAWFLYEAYDFLSFLHSDRGKTVLAGSVATQIQYILPACGIICLALSLWCFRRLYRALTSPENWRK